VTAPKVPLDERALNRLVLATDAARVSYEEQRLKLQTARKEVNDEHVRARSAQTQSSPDNEIT
jgi:hypothetical protein